MLSIISPQIVLIYNHVKPSRWPETFKTLKIFLLCKPMKTSPNTSLNDVSVSKMFQKFPIIKYRYTVLSVFYYLIDHTEGLTGMSCKICKPKFGARFTTQISHVFVENDFLDILDYLRIIIDFILYRLNKVVDTNIDFTN